MTCRRNDDDIKDRDVTPEQQQIIAAGYTVVGEVPDGLAREQLRTWIQCIWGWSMNEHDTVILIRPVHQGNTIVPTGTQGTIASVYRDDDRVVGYLLELRNHAPITLLKVEVDDVEADRPVIPRGHWLSYPRERKAARRARKAKE